jgi:ribosome-associated toxin RatA of RatAB toxin-antitoxin module
MRELARSALVPYTPAQMFALVSDLERYPEFVPWVSKAVVRERGANYVIGQLEMHRSGTREAFTTRNTMNEPHSIDMQLVEGPFKVLSGQWTFDDIAARGCKVSLQMKFEFSNPVLGLLLSRTFEKSCSELVDAFVARARAVYGAT